MKLIKHLLFLSTALCCSAANSLEEAFKTPPMSAKPQTFFHTLDGNLSKEGMIKDMQALKEVGLKGAMIFSIGRHAPDGTVDYMSDEWREIILAGVEEADRLGLEITLHNGEGWSSSGGPWITPEFSMQEVVWTELSVEGGKELDLKLPRPQIRENFYRDIAILAIPEAPGRGNAIVQLDAVVSASAPGFKAEDLLDGNLRTAARALPAPKEGAPQFITVDFRKPVTLRSAMIASRKSVRRVAIAKLQVSNDGTNFREVADLSSAEYKKNFSSRNFEATEGRWFRFLFEANSINSGSIPISEIRLSQDFAVEDLMIRGGYIRGSEHLEPPVLYDGQDEAVIRSADVVDLTAQVDDQGRLVWDAPAGHWTLVRIGHTSTGKRNHPSTQAGQGLEVDKLSKEAYTLHFENMMGKMIEEAGPLAGKALAGSLIDSYEVGAQNWTKRMPEEFEARAGYSIQPWLLTLTGRAVESVDATHRFLYDFRKAIDGMFADNYYGQFDALLDEHGLTSYTEPYGHGNFSTLLSGSRADSTVTEFWITQGIRTAPRQAVPSVAHTYGKKVVGAEAFTARPSYGAWRIHPGNMKQLGDEVFTDGVNQMVFHRYAHQPWADHAVPGMTMGRWGTHFDRTQTWWDFAPAYTDYLSRCQYLLQSGLYVADIALFVGEYAPDILKEIEAPEGYAFDYVNPDVLLNRARGENGRIVLPDGMSYQVLMLPDEERMSLEVAKKIKEFVEAGVVVVGPKPSLTWGLKQREDEAELRKIADALWDNGLVQTGLSMKEALTHGKIVPDFAYKTEDGSRPLQYIHRRIGDVDAWFVANSAEKAVAFDGIFRDQGRQPELWDPMTGSMDTLAVFESKDGVTRVPIQLDAHGSAWVVFRRPAGPSVVEVETSAPASQEGITPKFLLKDRDTLSIVSPSNGRFEFELSNGRKLTATVDGLPQPGTLSGAWTVAFDPKWKAPESIEFPELMDWTQHPNEFIKYYSGTAVYSKSFKVDAATLKHDWILDLGDVREMARIHCNGREIATLWHKPFRVDLSDALIAGENHLKIEIVNLWPNRLIGDEQYPDDLEWEVDDDHPFAGGMNLVRYPDWMNEYMKTGVRPVQERMTFTSWKHEFADSPLVPSGLLGPVRLLPFAQVEVSLNETEDIE